MNNQTVVNNLYLYISQNLRLRQNQAFRDKTRVSKKKGTKIKHSACEGVFSPGVGYKSALNWPISAD